MADYIDIWIESSFRPTWRRITSGFVESSSPSKGADVRPRWSHRGVARTRTTVGNRVPRGCLSWSSVVLHFETLSRRSAPRTDACGNAHAVVGVAREGHGELGAGGARAVNTKLVAHEVRTE